MGKSSMWLLLPFGLLSLYAFPQVRQYVRTTSQKLLAPYSPPQAPKISAPVRRAFSLDGLLALIARAEANRGYDTYTSHARISPSKPISTMTLAEVRNWQTRNIQAGANSSAAGRYQIIRSTLDRLKSVLRLPDATLFSPSVQDRLAIRLLEERGLSSFNAGILSAAQFAANISREWAGLPKDQSNLSYYAGVAGNRARVTFAQVLDVLGA